MSRSAISTPILTTLSMTDSTDREELGTYVINRQHAADVSVSYSISDRSSGLAVPILAASWSIPSPTAPQLGPRAQQDARGIGDASLIARRWLFDPRTHQSAN